MQRIIFTWIMVMVTASRLIRRMPNFSMLQLGIVLTEIARMS